MAKYLIVGDPHARPDNLHKIHKLFQLVESKELPVIWLGDLLDTKDIVRAQCLNAYINYFNNSKLNHIVLVGNHDLLTADSREHSLQALKLLKNVTVVDRAISMDKMLFLPYYRNPEDFRQAISQYKEANYLFMHQDIKNMDYGNGYISTEGNTLEDLKGFKLVISGHYHCYQDKENLIYLGTPFSHNFGESNQEKFLGVFNEEDGKFCTIPIDEFPRHVTFNIDVSDPPQILMYNDIDHIRVILKGTREQLDKFNKSVYSEFKIIEECVAETHKSVLKETESPESTFSKWFKEIKKCTDNEIHELGLSIIKDIK
jgi:DNA repair exonuclease SbcCD nuclease subunit